MWQVVYLHEGAPRGWYLVDAELRSLLSGPHHGELIPGVVAFEPRVETMTYAEGLAHGVLVGGVVANLVMLFVHWRRKR